MEFGANSSVDERSPAGARISRPTAARHQNGVRSKHARLCTSRARYGRGSFEYRRNPTRQPRSTVDLRSNFKAKNGLKSSNCDLKNRPPPPKKKTKTKQNKKNKNNNNNNAKLRTGFGALRTPADPCKSRRSPQ